MATRPKTGGRTKGTTNKTTKEIRAVLKEFINNELTNIESHLSGLTSKERLEILIKLIPYALPKIENISYSLGEPQEFDF